MIPLDDSRGRRQTERRSRKVIDLVPQSGTTMFSLVSGAMADREKGTSSYIADHIGCIAIHLTKYLVYIVRNSLSN